MLLRRTLLAASLVTLAATAQAAPAVGQAAPDFTLKDATGKTVKLSDFRGKHVVLEWTNPGCPFVRKHYSGNMQSTQKDAVAKGAKVLAWCGSPSTPPSARAATTSRPRSWRPGRPSASRSPARS